MPTQATNPNRLRNCRPPALETDYDKHREGTPVMAPPVDKGVLSRDITRVVLSQGGVAVCQTRTKEYDPAAK